MFSSHDHKMLPYGPRPSAMERRWKPDVEIAPNCPRCDSSNTKFCYYNNYSLSQPRYFCKDCRRYWTKGGSLRNVPIGGGCRKSRRPAKTIKMSGYSPIGTRDAAYARQLPPVSTLRPDMALDGMAGSSCQSTTTSSSDGSSDIDLAVLYSKFLNPGPAAVDINDEQFGSEVATSGSSYAPRMPAVQLLDDDQKLDETSMAEAMCMNNESQSSSSNLFVDQYSGLEPQLPFIPVGFGDDIFPSTCAALPGLASDHINPTVGEWTTLDQAGFDAFYAL